jgi:hypothetical protein
MRALVIISLFFLTPPNSPFDSYGTYVSWENEKARLDNFAIQLQNDQTSLGFILVYDQSGGCPGEAQARAERAKRYLVKRRGVRWNQVIWRRDGYQNDIFTYLVIAPRGSYVPRPFYSSSNSPEVNGPMTRACRVKLQQIRNSRLN